jgi:uncharacterized protein YndB with AHSA1/START domain
MATVVVSNEVGAPVEQVFAAFGEIEQASERVAAIKGIEMLTPGGFGLGTRWRETREVMGRLDSAEMEVTSFEKNRSYTITHYKGGARVDTTFRFEPSPKGTTVQVEFSLDGHGLPPGLLAPLSWAISGKVRDVLKQDLADLQRQIERHAAAT